MVAQTSVQGVLVSPPAHRRRYRELQKEVELNMPNKSRTRKHTHPAMSPLLRALTFSHAAREPITQAMLLQCYVGLDAFRRGHGSRELFTAFVKDVVARFLAFISSTSQTTTMLTSGL